MLNDSLKKYLQTLQIEECRARREARGTDELIMSAINPLTALGEVLVLLDDVSDLSAGFYVVHDVSDGWTVLRPVVDDEEADTLYIRDERIHLPVKALDLFMPVGINLSVPT